MIGRLIAKRYKVLSILGSGGMARVYRVFDQRLEREVALKLLKLGKMQEDEALRRFEREFHTAARVRHENAVELYDLEKLDDGSHFLTMELLSGNTLEDELEERARLSERESRKIGLEILAALMELHRVQIIHRDLKPSNIIFDEGGRTVLADFGLSLKLDWTGITDTGTLVGTPLYMSPEQILGKELDGRSDLYQCSLLLYEMLSGSPPYRSDDLSSLVPKILYDSPPRLDEKLPELEGFWSDFLERGLAKEARDRFKSAEQMQRALKERKLPRSKKPARAAGTRGHAGAPAGAAGTRAHAGAPAGAAGTRPDAGAASYDPDESAAPKRLPVDKEIPVNSRSRALVPGLVMSIIILLFLWTSMERATPPSSYGLQDYNCRPMPEGAYLSWNSQRAYPTSVKLYLPNEQSKIYSKGLTKSETRSHRILIGDLQGGRLYRGVILFPEGESYQVKVRSAPLFCALHSFREESRGFTLSLLLPPCKAVQLESDGVALSMLGPKREPSINPIMRAELEGPYQIWESSLEMEIAELEKAVLNLELRDGRKREVHLVTALRSSIDLLNERLALLDCKDFFTSVANELSDSAFAKISSDPKRTVERPEDGIEALALIDSTMKMRHSDTVEFFLERQSLRDSARYLAELAPLALSMRSFAFSRSFELYGNLCKLAQINVYLDHWGLRSLFLPLDSSRAGSFSLLDRPLPARARRKELLKNGNQVLKLGLGMAPLNLGGSTSSYSTSFTIENLEAIELAALEFRVESFDSLALGIYINESQELYLCDRPLFSHGDGRWVCLRQNIPLELLREGKNKVLLQVKWPFDDLTKNTIQVKSLQVALK